MHLTLLGNFNLPDIDWNTLLGVSAISCDFVFGTGLCQLINRTTHVHRNTVDMVLTNFEENSLLDCSYCHLIITV